jgi:predicted dehydrogenase
MSDALRFGILGTGNIARQFAEGVTGAKRSEVVAVGSRSREAADAFARSRDVRQAYATYDAVLDDESVEAVYVSLPNSMHCEWTIKALEAGKHVLCEKPLGMTVADAEEMIAVSREAGVMLGTAFCYRFNTQHLAALEMIEDGKLGTLTYGRAQLSCWYPPIESAWRQDPATGGGGSLIDMGGHLIDLLEMFFGELEAVSCFINNTVHAYESEDSATAMLRFTSGALATVDAFFCIPDNACKNVLEVYGSRGSIISTGTIGQEPAGEMTAYLEESDGAYEATQAREGVSGEAIAPEPVNTYMGEVAELSAAVLEGREPTNNAQLGLQSQKVLSACYESARTGKVVKLSA